MKMEDLASYSANDAFCEDALLITGDIAEMTPDPFCSACDTLPDRDERGTCHACSAISSDRDQLDRIVV